MVIDYESVRGPEIEERDLGFFVVNVQALIKECVSKGRYGGGRVRQSLGKDTHVTTLKRLLLPEDSNRGLKVASTS